MEKIKQMIKNTVKDAVFDDKEKLTITVEPKDLHPLLKTLHGNNELPFDYLVYLIGMDWGEKLGVIYLLSSSKDPSKELIVKSITNGVKSWEMAKKDVHIYCISEKMRTFAVHFGQWR
jgi:NADH-quinone oxidoreductase subunit C/D